MTFLREVFSKSREELTWCEADFKRLAEERNSLKLHSGQRKEEIRDLRAELAIAHKEQADLIEQVMKNFLEARCNISGMETNTLIL